MNDHVAGPGAGDLLVEPVDPRPVPAGSAPVRADPEGGKHAFAHSLAVAALADAGRLDDVPDHTDARALRRALAMVFEEVSYDRDARTLAFAGPRTGLEELVLPPDLTGLSRSLFGLYPALLTRARRLHVPAAPRGCALGTRPSEWYVEVLRRFGVSARVGGDGLHLAWTERRPADVRFDYPTMTGTVLAIAAAAAAPGVSTIENVSREPSCDEELACLAAMGGAASRVGHTLRIEGRASWPTVSWRVAQDRIHAVTYLTAGLLTGRAVRVDTRADLRIGAWLRFLQDTGCEVVSDRDGITAHPPPGGVLRAADVRAGAEPHLSSDWLPFAMLLLAMRSEGSSELVDDAFPERLQLVERLAPRGLGNVRLGSATVGGRASLRAVVTGRPGLRLRGGALDSVPDIRGSVAMVLALLTADAPSVLRDDFHVRRGHTDLAADLRALGLPVRRREGSDAPAPSWAGSGR